MSDEKLNTGPEEPKAPDVSGEAPAGPAPETPKPEQAGPAQPAPGDVVISADQIDELMAQKRQAARDAVEKEGDPPGKEAGAPAKEQPPTGDKEPKQPRRGRTAKTEKPAPEAGKEPKTAGARKGRPPKADKAAPDKPQPSKRDKVELLTKCLIIYYERKIAVKKTPIGVIPYILSSFLSSKRSPRGGSDPPLPLNLAARRVLSYAPTSERQTCPRTRSAACAAHPDRPARFAGRDAVALWDGSRCPAAFAHRVYHFRSNISPGKDSSGSLRGLPNTPSTHRWRCGTAPSREVLSHWGIDKHRSPHHKKRHPA